MISGTNPMFSILRHQMGGQIKVDIRSEVIAQFKQVAREQDISLAPLTDDLPLLSSGLDSLCFAILVSRMRLP